MSPRSRDRILENLEAIYREAYDRAKESGDARRMEELDSAFQREQLLIEVLLDVRDGLRAVVEDAPRTSALEKIQALRKLTKFR